MSEIFQSERVVLGYSPSISPRRNSDDVDFSDVFGGPPRRSSTQDSNYSARNSHSFDDNDDSEDVGSSWPASREKPVFGEAPEVRRRRYACDDFFDDIFRGDQPSSSSQSPRLVPRRSPFSSAPGSRAMSPSRSLPSSETFANPAKFNLPGRLSNTDFAASTSMSQSLFSPSRSRFNQSFESGDADSRSATRFSAFQRQDNSGSHLDGGSTDQSDSHSNTKGSESPIYATNFHFSIYKWPSKGVPLVFSLRKKSPRSKDVTKSDNAVVVKTKTNDIDKAREDITSGGLEDSTVRHNLPYKSSVSKKKSNTISLSSLLSHPIEGYEKDVMEKMEVKISTDKDTLKSAASDEVRSHSVRKTKVQQKPSSPPKNNNTRANATGKVQDFVKIFNQQEPLSKASGSPRLYQSHSRRWKDQKNVEVDHEIRFSSARMNDEMEASFVNWGDEFPDASEMDAEHSPGNQQFDTNDSGCSPDTVRQTSTTVPNVDNPKDSATNVDGTLNDEFKGYETKVLQWSKGKEGNIRALLSTLQYVLWPESGWKSIPLVEIIEASAVKRAYQKALLRLHPDKLQQKGAAFHHKFMAEKVFDILQEAWDQFNSVDSL